MAPTHSTAITTGHRAVLAALLFCVLAAPGGGMVLQTADRKGLLNVRKGFRFVDVAVEGNADSFLANNRQFGSDALVAGGRFAQTLRVDVDMEVLPNLSVRGRFDDTLYPAKQELAVEYQGDQFHLVAGDVAAGFAGAEFPMESQTLFGVRSKYTVGDHSLSAVAARMTGTAGHFENKGDNTRGPYFLPDRKLVPNSERVFVDGVRKFRGSDYTLDYTTGVLTFTQPVDDRFRIAVDYEFEALLGTNAQNLLVSRYAGEITTSASLGMSVGTKRGGTGAARDMFGFDGRWNSEGGTSFGAEVAMARAGDTIGEAVRGELAGSIGKGTWNSAVRAVQPEYAGLSAVTSRRDIADASLGFNYPLSQALKVSSRLATSRDNLGADPNRPTVSDYIMENSAIWTLPRATRLELSFDNRNELHQDDRDVHALDSSATSWRMGARYRLERHLLRTSYELRATEDRSRGQSRSGYTHVMNNQVQSQLFGALYSTGTLQLSRQVDADTGEMTTQEVLTGMDVSASLFKYLGTSLSYTLQQRTGLQASDTHSAGLSLRAQGLEALTAETSLQVKRTTFEDQAPLGNAIASARLGWQIGANASLFADFTRPIAVSQNRGPATMDIHGSFRPSKEWDLGGGYRTDELEDPQSPGRSYLARVGYMEVTISF